MKKISLVVTAAAGLILTSLAFAQISSNGYYTSQEHPLAAMSGALDAAPAAKATDIRITNGTSNVVHASVPNAVKMDVASGTSEHILHDTRTADTEIVLQGVNGNVIFDAVLCRYAMVTVSGDTSSSYSISVNRVYCN